MANILPNFVNGAWRASMSEQTASVTNPATSAVLAETPLSSGEDVEEVVRHAVQAFPDWRATPAAQRVQYLFRFKNLLEEHVDELARTITEECGKTYQEAVGELRRGIENVEVACGIPLLMQGVNNEDVTRGVDEHLFRQPLGVVAAITPFNFPGMIPLWFLPYAIACGNCFVFKPSEQTPQTGARLVDLLRQTGIPDGVVQLVHGGKETARVIVDHPDIRAISFVGSSKAAREVYARAAAAGKRVQCQGGAKNPLIVLPDADIESAARIAAESAFGCAGQRCLAASLAITVGDAATPFTKAITEQALTRKVGYGLEDGVEMGPVISHASRQRIAAAVEQSRRQGAAIVVDGGEKTVAAHSRGSFHFPTVMNNVAPDSELCREEVFGPVLGLMQVDHIDVAIALINRGRYGNMACLFTQSGAAARKFRHQANVGNLGVNVGVAAPMAFFPFCGWKDSFFGDLHAQGSHGVEFYTQTKVVIERWD